MSAPSKEEIASWTADMLADASRCIDIWNRAEASGRSLRGMIRPEGAYVIASLSDENERLLTDLREEVETNVELRAKLDSVRDENERLANELKAAQLDWDRLALENERLRAENEISGTAADMGRNTMAAQSDEIGRLRAENDRLMADALVRQTTEIALRAERAECLEAFAALLRMAKSPMRSWETGECIDARQVEELCEEMLAKLRGQP